jgi:lipopolysaccharide export system protein LptA
VFETPQASGSAVGMQYVAQTGTMNLLSAVVLTVNRPHAVHLTADRGVITKRPRQVVLDSVHMTRELQETRSDHATFFLHDDNTVDHILAEGDVETEIRGRESSGSNMSGSKISNSKAPGAPATATHERSDRAELFLTGTRNLLTTAILTGNVRLDTGDAASRVSTETAVSGASSAGASSAGSQQAADSSAEAFAGRAILHFAGQQILQTIHAEDGVRLSQKNSHGGALLASPSSAKSGAQSQDVEMTAPAMDFTVKDGHLLERAETSGPPQIVITQPEANQKTVVTAVRFTAKFTEKNRLATLHGEPDAKIVSGLLDPNKSDLSKSDPNESDSTKSDSTKSDATNSHLSKSDANKTDANKTGARAPTDRVSTSKMLDVVFLPAGGISSITQSGGLAYVDGAQKAWAQRGEYTASDEMLVLTGSPRVVDTGMTTTAQTIRMNRATGDALAEGEVKSTYSDLKPQPDGALLASSDPIHVTSRSMTAHRASSLSSAIAVYSGDARLWQDANVVEAPTLQFDRNQRSLVAQANSAQLVSTVLVQVDKTGKATPVHVTSARLDYADAERKVFLDGGVTAIATDATLRAQQMTVFLVPRSESQTGKNPAMPGQIDHIVAEQNVVLTQPARRAIGDRLVYTAADDKYVLTGGASVGSAEGSAGGSSFGSSVGSSIGPGAGTPGASARPSIFDAERGKTTGDSLTFYRHDDRVLVEGKETSPTVTRTQVAR